MNLKTFNGISQVQLINFLQLLKEGEEFYYIFNSQEGITATTIKKTGKSMGYNIKYLNKVFSFSSKEEAELNGTKHRMKVESKGNHSFDECFVTTENAVQHLDVRLGMENAECVYNAILYSRSKDVIVEFSVGGWTYMIDPSGQIQCKRYE